MMEVISMDYLSQNHLAKYEEIIDLIQNEHVRTQKLKKDIETAQNQLIISRLSETKNCKIGHVNIKVFNDGFELFNLYSQELNFKNVSKALNRENHKFYLVEIYISNMLLKMLENLSWSVNIFVKRNDFYFCKTAKFKNKSTSPFFEVLLIPEHIINCKVIVMVTLTLEGIVLHINLDTVDLDISYHFEMVKKPSKMSISRKLLEVTKNYSSDARNLTELHKPLLLEYDFVISINYKVFANILLKNCYQKIDLELFSELRSDSENIFTIQLTTGTGKVSISFDQTSKCVKVRSNFDDLCRIKKYFCEEAAGLGIVNNNLKKKILEIKTVSRTQLGIDEIRALYEEVRNLWATLPL